MAGTQERQKGLIQFRLQCAVLRLRSSRFTFMRKIMRQGCAVKSLFSF